MRGLARWLPACATSVYKRICAPVARVDAVGINCMLQADIVFAVITRPEAFIAHSGVAPNTFMF